MRKVGMLILLGCLAGLAACGGGGGGNSTSTITSVSASCSPSSIQGGQTSQCTASVSGTGNFSTAVTWSASQGSITSSGLFTAPTLPNVALLVTITATSTQDSTKFGTTTVTVSALTPVNNVQPIIVDAGPTALQPNIALNTPYTTVTVCVPGSTTQCQSIDHVLVDTGSSGLRLLSSVLTISLPVQDSPNGNTLGECNIFEDGFTWGTVALADITMAGEAASSVPVQVILPSSNSPAVPGSCSSQTTGPNEGDSVAALGSNGVLGVGLFVQDCGAACAPGFTLQNVYYDCPSGGCSPVAVPVAQQVAQPVSFFASDNNGVIIELPSVPVDGSATVNGSMIFGIGTQSNNGLGSATIYAPNTGENFIGDFTTVFEGNTYQASFIDSGSNAFFFPSAGTDLFTCPVNTSFFCTPGSTPTNPAPENFTATNQGANGTSGQVSFSVGGADALFSFNNGLNTAFDNLAVPNFSTQDFPAGFDWGLPFFFNRNVFVALENASTSGGVGPYWAY